MNERNCILSTNVLLRISQKLFFFLLLLCLKLSSVIREIFKIFHNFAEKHEISTFFGKKIR